MRVEHGNYIAENAGDCTFAEVLQIERYKDGVCRLHLRRDDFTGKRFWLVYAKDEYVVEAGLELPDAVGCP